MSYIQKMIWDLQNRFSSYFNSNSIIKPRLTLLNFFQNNTWNIKLYLLMIWLGRFKTEQKKTKKQIYKRVKKIILFNKIRKNKVRKFKLLNRKLQCMYKRKFPLMKMIIWRSNQEDRNLIKKRKRRTKLSKNQHRKFQIHSKRVFDIPH